MGVLGAAPTAGPGLTVSEMASRFALLGAAALAAALAACAAISGLSSYSAGGCQTAACDASVVPKFVDAAAEANEDAGTGTGGGCGPDSLTCEAGCFGRSSASGCGGCDGACDGATMCMSGVCAPEGEAGADASTDGGYGGVACPDGGCPSSMATGFTCPRFGTCNGAISECTTPGGCLCADDTQCLSKCVKVIGENDVSCGSHCTGAGGRDGFNCELASPGIPSLGTSTYSCPLNSGFNGSTLICDPTHTNCYCHSDAQCPSGKCIPSGNNASCSGGTCTGTGTPDYRGCAATQALQGQCNGIGYCYMGTCPTGICSVSNYNCYVQGVCLCTNDNQCESGKCVSISGAGGNSVQCGSNCTGSGSADAHSCQLAPSSVPCAGSGGTMCITTLTPAPVPNAGNTACLCVADSNCPSGKCVNVNGQCPDAGACTGIEPADSEGCQTATSVANTWSCSTGNCDNVTSPSGQCTSAGIPCWCTSDPQCPGGTHCASWAGCPSGVCTGTGTGKAFHCVP